MAEPYTPTDDEVREEIRAFHIVERVLGERGVASYSTVADEVVDALVPWLAEHDRQVAERAKAEALREAAEAVRSDLNYIWPAEYDDVRQAGDYAYELLQLRAREAVSDA